MEGAWAIWYPTSMVSPGKIVVRSKASKASGLHRPRGITGLAVFYGALGLTMVLIAPFVPFRAEFMARPFFDMKMTETTFRLFGAIVGLGAAYVGFAFWNLHKGGFVVYVAATGLNLLSNLLYFNPARGVVFLGDLFFLLYVLSQWKVFWRR